MKHSIVVIYAIMFVLFVSLCNAAHADNAPPKPPVFVPNGCWQQLICDRNGMHCSWQLLCKQK